MTTELTVRDVLHQLDVRLTRVEDDIRSLRSEMQAGFQALRDEMDRRFDRLTAMFVGLMISQATLVVGIAGLWLKM